MCDLIRIDVTLIHPADDDERAAATDHGVKGVLSIVSGGKDIPLDDELTPDDVINAIAGALGIIRDGLAAEWKRGRAEIRAARAREN